MLSARRETGSFSAGKVVSNETGQLVERTVTTVLDFFTVQLAEDSDPPTLEIPARVVNA